MKQQILEILYKWSEEDLPSCRVIYDDDFGSIADEICGLTPVKRIQTITNTEAGVSIFIQTRTKLNEGDGVLIPGEYLSNRSSGFYIVKRSLEDTYYCIPDGNFTVVTDIPEGSWFMIKRNASAQEGKL